MYLSDKHLKIDLSCKNILLLMFKRQKRPRYRIASKAGNKPMKISINRAANFRCLGMKREKGSRRPS